MKGYIQGSTNPLISLTTSEKSRLTSEKIFVLIFSFTISPQLSNSKFVTGMGLRAIDKHYTDVFECQGVGRKIRAVFPNQGSAEHRRGFRNKSWNK
jgi:hypothetical protein